MKLKTSLYLSIEIISVISLLLFSCDPADNRLKVVNDSAEDIYYFFSCDSSLNDLVLLRNGYYKNSVGDSSYTQSNQYIQKESFRNIPKKGLNAWSHFFENCKNEEIHFFIFLDSVVTNYTDDEIKSKKIYAKHSIYTLKELEQNNWTITYP